MNKASLNRRSDQVARRLRCPTLVVVWFVTWISSSTLLRADSPPTFLLQWGTEGFGNGQFEWPSGIAVDRDHHVYVVDTSNNRIQVFDLAGNFLFQWGINGSGNGQFNQPWSIALDRGQNVYVTDFYNNRVEKFDSQGNYLAQWGSSGSGNGQLSNPEGIAIDSSTNVFVCDTSNHRIQKFDSNGNYLAQWGGSGSGSGLFSGPSGVAVDSSNNVYVVDPANCNVQKFDNNGNFLNQWGGSGGGNGQFANPEGIGIDSSNNVYVADVNNHRVQKFDTAGNYVLQWPLPPQGTIQSGIAIDSSCNFIYTDANAYVALFANNTNIPPVILMQPAGQSVYFNGSVTLNVGVFSAAPVIFQWSSNNVPVASGTDAVLNLTNITLPTTYAVTVSNAFGGALSSNAVLSIVPAFVTTTPATGITSTSAVLNGTVSLGVDSVAWFEWGADTNYGNASATLPLFASLGTTNISVSFNLNGGLYHYRLTASNQVGVVYGNDQLLTVGLMPQIIVVYPAAVSTNGVAISALINPNGLSTRVRFKWGLNPSLLTNALTEADIGNGIDPVYATNFLSPQTPNVRCYCQIVASNYLGTMLGNLLFTNPTPVGCVKVQLSQWESVALSADGTRILTGNSTGVGYSTNSGQTFGPQAVSVSPVEAVACSADASVRAAASMGGYLYATSNSGSNWYTSSLKRKWNAITFSADGSKMAAVAEDVSGIYTSTNSGSTLILQTNGLFPFLGFTYIASSADGNKLVAAVGATTSGPIFTSSDAGMTWVQSTNAPLAQWYSVASSADGSQLLACAYPGYVLISTNSGVNWIVTGLQSNYWNSVAESADGTKIVALANNHTGVYGSGNGGIWTSTDSGKTWISNSIASWSWTCAAMSADGNEIAATVGYPGQGAVIYLSNQMPAPLLKAKAQAGQFITSWTVPSLPFNLQESTDLLNWTAVTNAPVLNFTNLMNEVLLPQSSQNAFFRLTH